MIFVADGWDLGDSEFLSLLAMLGFLILNGGLLAGFSSLYALSLKYYLKGYRRSRYPNIQLVIYYGIASSTISMLHVVDRSTEVN